MLNGSGSLSRISCRTEFTWKEHPKNCSNLKRKAEVHKMFLLLPLRFAGAPSSVTNTLPFHQLHLGLKKPAALSGTKKIQTEAMGAVKVKCQTQGDRRKAFFFLDLCF